MLLTSALSVFCVGVAVAQTVGNVAVAAKTDGVKAMTVSHICGLKAKAIDCDKVLARKAVGKNMMLKVVQDGQGRIYKTMEKGDGTTRLSRPFAKPHKTDATNAALFESFEGWQESYGMDWIPEGWTEKNTDANKPTAEMLAHNINNTWYCYYTGDGNWTPKTTDGEKDCFIHFTYDGSYTDRVKWSFGPGNMTDVIIEKDERNPLMAYPYTKEGLPMLEAYNDNGSDMFQWGETDTNAPYIQYGGKITDSGFDFGVGNYDYLHNRITTQLFSEGHYCFGTGSDDDWGAKLVSVASFFEKPAAPMFVNKMYMTLSALDADNDAEFDLIVHGIDDYGYMADTIARAKGKMSDVTSKGSLYNLPFKFYTIDANGQQNDTTFLFDRPILVEVSGFADNSKVRTFAAMSQSKNHDMGANYAYAAFELTDKSGNLKKYWYSASNILSDCNTSLVMSLDGVFSFVHADNAEITIPMDGGSVSEVIDSYFEAKHWTVTVNGVKYSLATPLTVDWLTILPSYGMSNNEHTSFYAPATTTEREMDVTIECRGGSQTFHVKQGGSSGISSTKVTAKPVVSVNGGVVTISGVASQVGSSAMLYSANGTLAAKTVVNADGTATLNANDLPSGVYVIKVAKQTVKFVK